MSQAHLKKALPSTRGRTLRSLMVLALVAVVVITGSPATADSVLTPVSAGQAGSRYDVFAAQVDRALSVQRLADERSEDGPWPAPESAQDEGNVGAQSPEDQAPASPSSGARRQSTRVNLPVVGAGSIDVYAGSDVIRLQLPDSVASSPAQAVGTEALYDSDRAPQLVRPASGGVQIFTVLESASAPTAVEYRLQLPVGWSLSQASGGYDVNDAGGTVRYAIDAPWARDAAGVSVPARYELSGDVLTLHVAHEGAAYPVVADPFLRIYDRHARQRLQLGQVGFWGRGYIASNCLTADIACESERGHFRAECTAQSKAMRSLARYNNRWAWIPPDRLIDSSGDPIDDLVHWEVGRYKGQQDGDCQSPESAAASTRTWRADIVVQALSRADDLVAILEVKEWQGDRTRERVQTQLDGYLDRFEELRESGGPRAVEELRLTSAQWAWCYENNGKALLGNRREYCAWADLPGHIYFAPVDRLSERMLSDLRERFARTQEAERNADDSLVDEPEDTGDDSAPDDGLTEQECVEMGGYWSTDGSVCIFFV